MTVWFTADPHFNHANIIQLCDRPFDGVEMMDSHIVSSYQSIVQNDDDLWILGDFTAGRQDEAGRNRVAQLFAAIPGRKHLVIGNHDRDWVRNLGWASTQHFADIAVDGRRVILCHYPMITFPGARRGAIQLFGHVHQNWAGSRNSVNVGVDQWDFTPVTIEKIEKRAASLPVNPIWPLVEPGTDLRL